MALENVMRVNKGKIIGGGTPESYPADKVIMSDGTTSVEDAIDEVSSSSSTTKSTSYGTLYITRYGKVVELNGKFSNLPTSEWSTFATGLPLPKSRTQHQLVNLSADGNSQVSVNLEPNGELQYYGRGSISAFVLEVTYISE